MESRKVKRRLLPGTSHARQRLGVPGAHASSQPDHSGTGERDTHQDLVRLLVQHEMQVPRRRGRSALRSGTGQAQGLLDLGPFVPAARHFGHAAAFTDRDACWRICR